MSLWHLTETRLGEDLLLCDLHRAESIIREHLRRSGVPVSDLNDAVLSREVLVSERDKLGMVWYPGEVCCTLTSSSAHERWIGGPAAGSGRFVTPSESAAFQGLDTHGGAFCSAQYHLTEIQLHHAIGASLHSRMADFAVTAVKLLLHPDADVFTVGSLYSGAFDELGAAVKRVFGPVSTVFTAERQPKFCDVLREAYCPRYLLSEAGDAFGMPSVDILVASPPCVEVSRARRPSNRLGDPGINLNDLAEGAVHEQARVLTSVIMALLPRAVIVEQSDGLYTHHRGLFTFLLGELTSLPYYVHHRTLDAHVDFRASHHRSRLLFVLIRSDCRA